MQTTESWARLGTPQVHVVHNQGWDSRLLACFGREGLWCLLKQKRSYQITVCQLGMPFQLFMCLITIYYTPNFSGTQLP